jgi:hypothetical protein
MKGGTQEEKHDQLDELDGGKPVWSNLKDHAFEV